VRDAAEALRAYLDAHSFEPVTLTDATRELEASPTQVARAFAAAFGITPHAYVVGRRLDAARTRILDGQPLAAVATEVGFYDQAHLTRRFKRFLGVTPGQFGASRARSS
jgi:AraC-like DNA-binding protein